MPQKPEPPPILHLVPPGTKIKIPLGSPGWEPHPDGQGGFRPTDRAKRGDIDIDCEQCGKPLVRDAGRKIVMESSFGCPAPCNAKYLGETLFADKREPPSAGAQ